ncbi:hypothetical protein MHBO_001626 [Bonamia ostreae]|uniref:Uncharacterized protein n=1 Tax=Bonamia ostreae TaxID=126728 RepID=A0ABV2AK76_9EUKA
MAISDISESTTETCTFKSKEFTYQASFYNTIENSCIFILPENTEYLAPYPKNQKFVFGNGPVLVKCVKGAHVENADEIAYKMECENGVVSNKNCVFGILESEKVVDSEEYIPPLYVIVFMPFTALFMGVGSFRILVRLNSS